jgi:protein TonB
MLSSWTKFLFAATPENALGASAVVHVAALAVMAIWTIGRIAEPPQFGGSAVGLRLELVTDDPEPEPPAVEITADIRPSPPPPDFEVTDRRITPATTNPPRLDEKVEVDRLEREPAFVQPPTIERQESMARDTRLAQREPPIPFTVPRRTASRPQPPAPVVSHERTPPDFSARLPLVYPDEARRRGWQGVVLLRLHINTEGRVTQAEVIRSSGYNMLDEAAVRAVRQWEGQPAHIAGRAVASVEVLPIRFRLQ